MQAARYHGREDVRIEEIDIPSAPKAGEVKIKVAWCGICGTDLHEWLAGPLFTPSKGKPHPVTKGENPVTMGHEFSGTVTEVGDGVTTHKVGQNVAVEPTVSCRACKPCNDGQRNICHQLGFHGLSGADGGLAAYACIRASQCHILPASIPLDIGAMIEPLAVAMHAVKASRIQPGQSALVVGAGPIGAMVVKCLRAKGAGTIIVSEPTKARSGLALKAGADVVVNPLTENLTAGEGVKGFGVDVSFDAAGTEATARGAIEGLKPRGICVNIAIWEKNNKDFDVNMLLLGEKMYTGVICYVAEDFQDVIKLLAEGKLSGMEDFISAKLSLKETTKAFEELRDNRDSHVKILIKPVG